jgi:hypothetical protein
MERIFQGFRATAQIAKGRVSNSTCSHLGKYSARILSCSLLRTSNTTTWRCALCAVYEVLTSTALRVAGLHRASVQKKSAQGLARSISIPLCQLELAKETRSLSSAHIPFFKRFFCLRFTPSQNLKRHFPSPVSSPRPLTSLTPCEE